VYSSNALTIASSTLSGNSATGDRGAGGGVFSGHAGTLVVTSSTFCGNSATYYGGGIYAQPGGTLTVINSVVAGNEVSNEGPDVHGLATDTNSYNLIGDGSGMSGIVDGENGNLVGTAGSPIDPRLGPLGDYGGPTWTMPLLGGSPAIDAGDPDPATPPPTDQRGFGRFVDGDGDGKATIDIGAYEYVPAGAVVVDRRVFYNNSAFDGDDAAASGQDDNAIAPDKHALLPGQSASFANYTSYGRGINGIMVDVVGLAGTPTVEDFRFRVGSDEDPSGWGEAPVPARITVRPGDGVDGSDRVTIVWPDGAIVGQWLQVAVLPTAVAGLAVPDVFYFGNAVGEAGNSAEDAKVNVTDMLLARNNPRSFLAPAEIDFAYDFNRDGRVNATDMLLARNNPTSFVDALKLISVPEDIGELIPVPEDLGEQPIPPPGGSAPDLAWLQEFDASASDRPAGQRTPWAAAMDAMAAITR
jgi:predicted outer membrane repeat protein